MKEEEEGVFIMKNLVVLERAFRLMRSIQKASKQSICESENIKLMCQIEDLYNLYTYLLGNCTSAFEINNVVDTYEYEFKKLVGGLYE